jgi:hypothetical protein
LRVRIEYPENFDIRVVTELAESIRHVTAKFFNKDEVYVHVGLTEVYYPLGPSEISIRIETDENKDWTALIKGIGAIFEKDDPKITVTIGITVMNILREV